MSSSSSSGSSDEDAAASNAAAPSTQALAQAVELAQICSFCSTFRAPLRLPSFSRTELQEALLGASNGDRTHVELLAELHFKLAREHPTAKMDKMVQDWEKTLARKLQENWRKEFTANPMGGGVAYRDLTVYERVKILDALCHWKLDTCGEIHKHIATLQKENDNEAIKKLRAGEIGTDDKGVSYWYFDDGCWIYAEDKPRWQLEERKPSYAVEFASAKRIRLSINFDPDHNSSAPPIHLPRKTVAFSDDVKETKEGKKEAISKKLADSKVDGHISPKSKVKVEGDALPAVKPENEHISSDLVKGETQEGALSKTPSATSIDAPVAVKAEAAPPAARRMDINVLCAPESPSSEEGGRKSGGQVPVDSHQPNGYAEDKTETKEAAQDVPMKATTPAVQEASVKLGVDEKKDAHAPGEHVHATVVAVVGSKKRTIIDDDSSDSSSEAGISKAKDTEKVEHQTASSPPPRKKRKASIENTNNAVAVDVETSRMDMAKLNSVESNGVSAQASEEDPVTTIIKEEHSIAAVEQGTTSAKGDSSLSTAKDEPPMTPKADTAQDAAVDKTGDATNPAKTSGPASTSPTDPAAAPESFDITCESCKKCYDMRYLDPPLVERPTDEWRCFECLVNDARGWPRRRKRIPREPFSPRADGESSLKKRSSSSKSRSGSSSSKKSRKSSSKSRSSSSSKKKSSRSSSSKQKSSSGKSSSKKASSSSSSKKHKKHKSSSSSHHRSSSHGHHRRRHHSHYHHEEFAKLASSFRERQEQRLGIEDARIKGDLEMAVDEAPQGWRVVSSTLDDLRALIESLSGGSLEQDRLRGRLILIMKDQEKLEEQRRKQQELAWNILPRRQSSRIAIGRMKNQSAQDSDAEDGYSDDDVESRRPGLRSRRSMSDGGDGSNKHDRAWRARRRHQPSDDDMDLDDQEEEVDSNGVPLPSAGDWMDWSLLKENTRHLSTVCLALVNRLLKEEAADLFSRPVDPELDGCPNYLSVITHPMDLGTIRSRVESSFYRRWKLFKKDVDLVWHNCRTFNAPDTMVVQFADVLAKLTRSMCVAAEKRGVDKMRDEGSGGGESGHDSDDSASDASKAESRGSVTKAWTESSASESSDSSDGGSSSHDDSDVLGPQRRSTRRSSKKSPSRSRPTRSGRPSGPVKTRPSRSTRSHKKRPAPSSSEDESSSASDEEGPSPVRKPRQVRSSASKTDGKTDPPTEDEDPSDDSANNQPPPPGSGAPSPSPPPPPPPQAVQKRPKPRLIISDSSSSDSSDSDSNSSSSSSSDSDSDSDAAPAASKRPQPPPPSAADVPAPPPPSPPPPAASPVDGKPPAQSTPKKSSSKTKTPGSARKAKAAKTGSSGYSHSPSLLNSYLSPSSSSSSDFSSGDSESSDSDDSD